MVIVFRKMFIIVDRGVVEYWSNGVMARTTVAGCALRVTDFFFTRNPQQTNIFI
jgi:hypothetical protein